MKVERCAVVPCTLVMLSVLVTLLISDFLMFTHAASLNAPTSHHHRPRRQSYSRLTYEQQQILNQAPYLAKLGYLSNGRPDRTQAAVNDVMAALRKYQQIANITETGTVDWTTEKKMSSQRCGMTDANIARSPTDPQNYELLPSKWGKNYITWSLDNATPDMETGRVRRAISDAFNLWKEVSALNFQEVHTDSKADIRLRFDRLVHGDGFPFDGPGKTLAHAFAPGEMQGGDVHFDEDETWTEAKTTGTNLYTVAAHELGHSLGISHSRVVGALMYPYYAGYNPEMRLHNDDIAAIQSVYGAPLRPNVATSRPTSSIARITARPAVTQPSRTTTATPPIDSPPNPCTTIIDAIAYMRSEIFVFKGKWFWRLNKYRVIVAYPVLITDYWIALPRTVKKVDAVVERSWDSALLFFIGDRYYELDSNTRMVPGFPSAGRSIAALFDLPSSSTRVVNAAFVWPNGNVKSMYITVGYMYYLLTPRPPLRVEGNAGSIRNKWPVVQLPLDAAFTQPYAGYSYFFKDGQVWQFNTSSSTGDRPIHLALKQLWPQCPENLDDTRTMKQEGPNSGPRLCHIYLADLLWMSLLVLLLCNNRRLSLL